MKRLMTGNEAIARGAFEAGVTLASAYPGTPSTEILENIAQYKDSIYSEWAPNEKVALEVAIGGSIAGARTLAAMKHVGLNVAADPFFTYAYTGVNGGFVLVTADDPGMHSSQNEQDNRYYAKFAKVPMLEPSNSQEAKEFVKEAYKISEEFDVPMLLRVTTRICHSKSLVEFADREEVEMKPYVKNGAKYIASPANSKVLHVKLEEKLKKLEEYSNKTSLNYEIWNNKKIGVITSGVSFNYAEEVFGEDVSYLKLGMTYPLPMAKIKEFANKVEILYIVEELEPYIETEVRAVGIKCFGKDKISNIGELNPDIIRKGFLNEESEALEVSSEKIVNRPPTLCAGCPHRGFFYELSKRKNVYVSGDIGCYTLGAAPPLSTTDSVICMGASVSAGHGFAKACKANDRDMKVFSVIGDSTFFHSGITGLVDLVYNGGHTTTVVLDNRITGMTGHQDNPGTGYTLMGDVAPEIDIEKLVKAIGIKDVDVINPLNLEETRKVIEKHENLDKASVIITKWPCALKRFTEKDHERFNLKRAQCFVDQEKCRKCKMCLKVGCPAISMDKDKGANIDLAMCVGCDVCLQVCPFDAIQKVKA